MTEYINRNELLSVLNDKYESIADINSIIIDMKPADVIEREKVNKAIEEIEKEIKSDFWKSDVTFGLELAKKIFEKNLGE